MDNKEQEIVEYLKEKDDEIKEKEGEIKVLNSRINILKETLEIKSGIVEDVKKDYSSMIWDIKGLENEIENIKMDYSRMERKLKFNSISIYVQPFVWTAGWLFAQWLLRG